MFDARCTTKRVARRVEQERESPSFYEGRDGVCANTVVEPDSNLLERLTTFNVELGLTCCVKIAAYIKRFTAGDKRDSLPTTIQVCSSITRSENAFMMFPIQTPV